MVAAIAAVAVVSAVAVVTAIVDVGVAAAAFPMCSQDP